MSTTVSTTDIFPQGDKGPADYFVGTAWVKILVPKDETGSYSVGNVVFEPKTRNNWHTHPAGQILLITKGNGYYQERGQSARLLSKGDVVVIPSNVEHWHGATKDSRFVHVVITNVKNGSTATWLEPVTDQDYDALPTR
jgi:4-carboxymuconolactone decarboxylase